MVGMEDTAITDIPHTDHTDTDMVDTGEERRGKLRLSL